MQYISTRGRAEQMTSAGAIVKGIAEDGGLFVPESIPYLDKMAWEALLRYSYQEQAAYLLSLFLSDFSFEEIQQCVKGAYSNEHFDHSEIAPLVALNDEISILELWHGPTAAFKDMALQILPHFLQISAQKIGETKEIVILVATSGDTGKAALEGFKDVAGTQIVVFFPEEGVSAVQKQQMVTQSGNNVWVASIDGNFDDAQNAVKMIFDNNQIAADLQSENQMLSSANSINWGRLVPQIVYYITACANMKKQGKLKDGETINVVVPTGNFGNILAAYYAKCMGAPIHKLICASNENHILTDFIRTGIYDRRRAFYKTLSPSMDILISSNLERLLFELTEHDSLLVQQWMYALKEDGMYAVDACTHEKVIANFWAGFTSDHDTLSVIEGVWRQYGYLMDTHTAVGYNVYQRYLKSTGDHRKTILASTASPFKFTASAAEAIMPETKDKFDEFALLKELSAFTGQPIPSGLKDLEQKPILFKEILNKEKIAVALLEHLKIK